MSWMTNQDDRRVSKILWSNVSKAPDRSKDIDRPIWNVVMYRVIQNKLGPWNFKQYFRFSWVFLHETFMFVGNSYSQLFTNFSTFILLIHQMALILPQVTIIFILSRFEYSPRKWKCQKYSVPALQKRTTEHVFCPHEINLYLNPPICNQNVMCGLVGAEVEHHQLLVELEKFAPRVMVSAGVCVGRKGHMYSFCMGRRT